MKCFVQIPLYQHVKWRKFKETRHIYGAPYPWQGHLEQQDQHHKTVKDDTIQVCLTKEICIDVPKFENCTFYK